MGRKDGFTLLELLLVMAMIGALGALFINIFPSSQKRARDTERISDLKQYQTLLEGYANNKNGLYPHVTTGMSGLCASAVLNLSPCPIDPKDGQNICTTGLCRYSYVDNGSNPALRYVLSARLEQPSDTTKPFFVVCSTGTSGESTTAGSGGNCPI